MQKLRIGSHYGLLAILLIGLLGGCSRGPMKPTKDNAEKFTMLMQAAGQTMTAKERTDAQLNDEGRRHATKKLLVDPFKEAGFDLDATLSDYSIRIRDGSLTADEEQVAILVLYMFQNESADLARWGFIKNETGDLIKAAHDKIQ